MPPYLNAKGGSKKAKELINLANEVANHAKKDKWQNCWLVYWLLVY